MPTDAQGSYSLPAGYEAVTGETIEASQHNPPLEDIETALSQRMMKSGVTPMTGPLLLSDGDVADPAATFNTAQSTGLYKTSDGIGVAVGGTKVAEFTSAGIKVGAHFIGELIPWTRLTAPGLCVLPYGQNLLRADYPDAWTIIQAEIGLGNTFYNSGNGSTTFGVGDMRGRVPAGKDDMGGSAASRLGNASFFGSAARTMGGVGGTESVSLVEANNGPHVHTGPSHSHTASAGTVYGASGTGQVQSGSGTTVLTGAVDLNGVLTGGGGTGNTGSSGSGTGHVNYQPTMIVNYALFLGA